MTARIFCRMAAVIMAAALIVLSAAAARAQEPPQPEEPWHVSDSEISSAVKKIQAAEPDFYKSLMVIRKEDDAQFRDLVTDWIFHQRDMEEMKKFNPGEFDKKFKPMFDLQKQERAITAKYRLAEDSSTKDNLKKQLMDTLNKLFDKKLELQKDELKELEKRLSEVKQDIERRRQNKDKIIQRRFEELVGVEEDLRW